MKFVLDNDKKKIDHKIVESKKIEDVNNIEKKENNTIIKYKKKRKHKGKKACLYTVK